MKSAQNRGRKRVQAPKPKGRPKGLKFNLHEESDEENESWIDSPKQLPKPMQEKKKPKKSPPKPAKPAGRKKPQQEQEAELIIDGLGDDSLDESMIKFAPDDVLKINNSHRQEPQPKKTQVFLQRKGDKKQKARLTSESEEENELAEDEFIPDVDDEEEAHQLEEEEDEDSSDLQAISRQLRASSRQQQQQQLPFKRQQQPATTKNQNRRSTSSDRTEKIRSQLGIKATAYKKGKGGCKAQAAKPEARTTSKVDSDEDSFDWNEFNEDDGPRPKTKKAKAQIGSIGSIGGIPVMSSEEQKQTTLPFIKQETDISIPQTWTESSEFQESWQVRLFMKTVNDMHCVADKLDDYLFERARIIADSRLRSTSFLHQDAFYIFTLPLIEEGRSALSKKKPTRKSNPQAQKPRKEVPSGSNDLSVLHELNSSEEEDTLAGIHRQLSDIGGDQEEEEEEGIGSVKDEDGEEGEEEEQPLTDQSKQPELFLVELRSVDLLREKFQRPDTDLDYLDWVDIQNKFESSPDERYSLCSFEHMQLTVSNGLDKMYRIILDQKFMEDHKLQTGIEGSWSSFFDLLKSALDQNSLTLSIKLDQFTKEKVILLKIHYPLMAGAKISGVIKLYPRTGSYNRNEVRGEKRQSEIRDMLFRLAFRGQDSLQRGSSAAHGDSNAGPTAVGGGLPRDGRASMPKYISVSNPTSKMKMGTIDAQIRGVGAPTLAMGVGMSQVPDAEQKSKKRSKPRVDLITPTARKRRTTGLKFL